MYIDPEAYKKDPTWIKLDKSARRWRRAAYWLFAFAIVWPIAIFIIHNWH